MRLLGETTEGVYAEDPMDAIHPDIIDRYYGVVGPERLRNPMQTGAGVIDEEDHALDIDASVLTEENEEHLENMITEDQEHNIRHAPVRVARHQNPFETEGEEVDFFAILAMVASGDIVPEGYGVLQEEWDDDHYPELEVINTGARGLELEVTLPRQIWLPRAICWAQALDLMERSIVERDGNHTGSLGVGS